MTVDEERWLTELGEIIEAGEKELKVVNPNRVKHVEIVKQALEEIVDGVGVSVRSEIHSPVQSMGFVRVTGKQIVISDYDIFAKICDIASVVDICPKTDGRVDIDFTFHGLTKRR